MAEELPRTGALFDPHDQRDKPLYSSEQVSAILSSSSAPATGVSDPFVLDDLQGLPVYDQRQIGSCVANACCAALRYAYKKYTGEAYSAYDPSRLWAYYYGRLTPNQPDLGLNEVSAPQDEKLDTGTWNRAVLHTFLMRGVCKESLWPHGDPISDRKTHIFFGLDKVPNPTQPADWGLATAQAQNSSHPHDSKAFSGEPDMIPRAISYYRISDSSKSSNTNPNATPTSAWANETQPSIQLLEQALRDGFPFIFCSQTFETASFWSSHTKNGVYIKPADAVPLKWSGGHALMAVGFSQSKRAFLIQNSWGEYYDVPVAGSKGRFWMPYEWFELVLDGCPVISDYWVIKCYGKR